MPLDRPLPDRTALILVDLQLAVDDPRWARHGPRNNPGAMIRPSRTRPTGPADPAIAFKPEVAPAADETIIAKQVNSAFIGTDLHRHLRDIDAPALVILGVITNNSLEATVRNAGNLGHAVFVPEDACFTYGWQDLRGKIWTAEDVHALSLANLHGEYATVTSSVEILASVPT